MYQCSQTYMLSEEIKVRCGKCDNCRALGTAHWQFRLMQEEKRSLNALFVTLTYDTKYLPFSNSGYPTLDKKAIPAFIKRLRSFTKRTDKGIRQHEQGTRKKRPKVDINWMCDLPAIKYYGVGEYGHSFKRPHYHVIIFNANADAVLNAWQMGSVHIGTVSGASVGYTLKYIRKRTWEGHFEGDDRTPIFSLMSKGLGEGYINPKTVHYHKNPDAYYLALEGRLIPMSRYYRDKMFTKDFIEDVADLQKARMLENNVITENDYYEKVFQAYQCTQQNLNKKRVPCDLNFTHRPRVKTKPIKRSTGRVLPSQIKPYQLQSSFPDISEVSLLRVDNQYIQYMNPPLTRNYLTFQSIPPWTWQIERLSRINYRPK